ncbi:MAG: glycosyltransferase family 39 protein [Elusimicrobia bacterium]|nr:glycosyltransferase family 39 protein [Elusimicrobiota bacterium]
MLWRIAKGRTAGPRWTDAGLVLAGLLLAAVYITAARGAPVGSVGDDALHIILARSLSHGSFSWPDATGLPVAEPLPGLAWLLCLPIRLLAPRWDLLRLAGLAAAATALFFFWRLAARLLGRRDGAWALLLLAANPLFVRRTTLVLPDMPFLAVSLYLCATLDRPSSRGRLLLAAALAGWAAVLRPLGFLLPAALAAAIGWRDGWRRAGLFLAAALAPFALWTARSQFAVTETSGYLDNFASQTARLASPRALAEHAGAMLANFFGAGVLGLELLGAPLRALLGAAALILAGWGARRLMRGEGARPVFVLTACAAGIVCVHLDWLSASPRYALALLPAGWLLIVAGAREILRGRRTRDAVLLVFLAAALLPNLLQARANLRGPAKFLPETMAWIRSHTPKDAVFESPACQAVVLLGGRRAHIPGPAADTRDRWLAETLSLGTGYLHIDERFRPDGFQPSGMTFVLANLNRWAESSPYVERVYRNAAEGSTIYRIRHPDPSRFGRAWFAYETASLAMRRGASRDFVRRELEAAVTLEPNLAYAWAALSQLESGPAARRAARRACAADPLDETLRQDMKALP